MPAARCAPLLSLAVAPSLASGAVSIDSLSTHLRTCILPDSPLPPSPPKVVEAAWKPGGTYLPQMLQVQQR